MTTNINSVNPGGRLHDDFSGPNNTKDVYVENYGDQNIYARVRLDEYMEVGDGAGKYTITETNGTTTKTKDAENKAVSLVEDATYEDETTWTTHIPGESELGDGAEQGFADSDETFHKYWKWTFGGSTTYMPTFNKDNTSLAADINGTYEGKTDTTGHYDDYVDYNTDEYKDTGKIATATYASETAEETHTAQETLTASVITMATYNSYPDTSEEEGVTTKKNFIGWVYDTDGWAYWSQAIEPGTATGLLLDKVENATKNGIQFIPQKKSFYAINVIGEFITADDIGSAKKGDGFYSNGSGLPSSDALALLDGIGVQTGTVTLRQITKNGDETTSKVITEPIELTYSTTATDMATVFPSIDKPVDGGEWAFSGYDEGVISIAEDDEDAGYYIVTAKKAGTTKVVVNYQTSSGSVIATDAFIVNVTEKAQPVGSTYTIGGNTYTALAVNESLKAADGSTHKAVLLLANNGVKEASFNSSRNNIWSESYARSYLNDATSGWASTHTVEASKAVAVNLTTHDSTGTASTTTDSFFLLSQADLYGKHARATHIYCETKIMETAEASEYTYIDSNGDGVRLISDSGTLTQAVANSEYAKKNIIINNVWWTRTGYRDNTEYVGCVQANKIDMVRKRADMENAYIRPAFWYDLGTVSTGSN